MGSRDNRNRIIVAVNSAFKKRRTAIECSVAVYDILRILLVLDMTRDTAVNGITLYE